MDYGDLNARAGHHESGYVEPVEAATEILEEAIEPFVENLARYLDLGLQVTALETCKGVILGLYRLNNGEPPCTLVDWAPDFPSEAADRVLTIWRDGVRNEGATFPEDFVAGFVPKWRTMIERILHGKDRDD